MRVDGKVWPEKFGKELSVEVVTSREGEERKAGPPEPQKKPKNKKEKKEPAVEEPVVESDIDVLFEKTECEPVLYYTYKRKEKET